MDSYLWYGHCDTGLYRTCITSFQFRLLAAWNSHILYGDWKNGMFSSPNSSSIMNSVPAQDRGVASGMMSTLINSAATLSMAIFFTIVIVGIPGSTTGCDP